MAVRVRLRVRAKQSGKAVETTALVNSGFETDRPQLLIPLALAEELGLWPELPPKTRIEVYGTAGGAARLYVAPNALEVSILIEGETPSILCDALISDIEHEVLIGDKLGGALGLILEDLAEGIWRLKTDPPTRARKSHPPQYW